MVSYKVHWSVRLSPSLIGTDNVYYYPFRMCGYTKLQDKVMWSGQGSVSLMVPMLTTSIRSVMMVYHIEGSVVNEVFFTCTKHIHFTS